MSKPACVAFNFSTKEEQAISVEEAPAVCRDGLFCWIDVDASANPEAAKAALESMGVNCHAIEEALGPDSDGRHDLYDDCLHLAVTAAHFREGKLAPSHVDMLIGENFMVTLRRGEVEFLDQVRRCYRQDFRKFAKTGSFLLYEYWDALIDSYKRAMRGFEGHAERVQSKIFSTEDDTLFNDVSDVTRDLLRFRKMLLASREVLSEISSRRSPFVSESTQPFLERMASTLERLSADLTVERETLAETLNLYMGIVSHRTNRVVNRLTVISMIFLPLSFLAGVYGMNFNTDAGNMPELGWRHGYLAFWVMALLMAAALLVFMKRNAGGEQRRLHMLRRAFAWITFASAGAFALILFFYIRGHFASDEFHVVRWDPTTRTFREFSLVNRQRGVVLHAESTIASPKDNATALAARAGSMHTASPGGRVITPLLWGDHYRCSPINGMDANGLSDCRTLEFRTELPLTAFAVMPVVWGAMHFIRKRRAARRGFTLVDAPVVVLSNSP